MHKAHVPTAARGFTALAAALLLAACAATATRPEDVATRAQARWDAVTQGDFATAYQYLAPGYRSSVSSVQYQRSLLTQKVHWTGAKVIDSDCSDNTCKVSISLDFEVVKPVPGLNKYDGTQKISEDWILADGQWWYVPPD